MKNLLISLLSAALLSLGTASAWAADPAASSSSAADKSTSSSAASASARSSGSVDKININTADADALQQLPGIDADAARAIIAARPFKSVEDLAKVDGVGEARLEILKEQITVAPASGSSEPQLEPTGRPSSGAGKSSSSPSSTDSSGSKSSSQDKTGDAGGKSSSTDIK